MTGEVYDYPTRILVRSESDPEDAYLVELTDFPVPQIDDDGNGCYVFNGSCQCRHFICDLRPRLRDPLNKSIYRCKHLNWARQHALDKVILPYLKKADTNIPEDHQT